MTDDLETTCAALKAPTIELMSATMLAQGNPGALVRVQAAVEGVRAVLASAPSTTSSPAFDAWAASISASTAGAEAGVESRDPRRAWQAFTDPVRGFDQLGQACAGMPGW
jgi:hypothetical protein